MRILAIFILLSLSLFGCSTYQSPHIDTVPVASATTESPKLITLPPNDISLVGRTCGSEFKNVKVMNLTSPGKTEEKDLHFGDRCYTTDFNYNEWEAIGIDKGQGILIRYVRKSGCGRFADSCCPNGTLFFLSLIEFKNRCQQDENWRAEKIRRDEAARKQKEAVQQLLDQQKTAVQRILGEK